MSGEKDETKGAVSVIPTLEVDDLTAALDYYSRLGFRHEWSYPEEGRPSQVGVCSGDVTLMLSLTCTPGARIERQNLYLVMRDLGALRRRVATAGGPDLPPVEETDYRMRDFSLTDPWGHHVTFGEDAS